MNEQDVYKIALDTRNFEIGLFWQRTNYFLALNTALAVGFFNLQGRAYPLLLALLGLIVSILWYQVALGSKFWQSRWENRLRVVEQRIGHNLELFSADWNTIRTDVAESLGSGNHKGFQRFLDTQILKKYSVSYNMTLLSLLFVATWTLLFVLKVFV
jgi:hypothetical protein